MERGMKRIAFLGLILSLAGCGDGGGTDAGMTDAGPFDAGGEVDAGGNNEDDAGMTTGDGNNTFASADAIEVDAEDPTAGVIATDGDLDFYTFEGTADQWISINTDANPDDDPEMIDTVITLYDGDMNQIAENDDAVPRASTDSEIVIRLPETGTYYIEVQEFSTWAGEPDESGSDFTYDLTVGTLTAGGALNVDGEAGDTVAEAQDLTFQTAGMGQIAFVLGDFNDATDVDVYAITIGAGEQRNLSVNLMPVGEDGYGSTVTPERMWVTDMAGTVVIGQLSPAGEFFSLEPSLPEGDYNLFIEHGGTAGANDFYVLKTFLTGDNPLEDPLTDVTNGVQATADDLTFAATAAGRSGFILADLNDGDTDHFNTVMTNAGEEISVVCGSQTLGSGVTGLSVAVLNPDGSVLAMDSETATHAPLIEDRATTAGTIYTIRLTKTGQSPTVTGDWVRCGVHLAVPAP
jgi:hypothetical protein